MMKIKIITYQLFACHRYTLQSQYRRTKSHFLRREIARQFRLMSENSKAFYVHCVRAVEREKCANTSHESCLRNAGESGENRKCSVKVRRCLHPTRMHIYTSLPFSAISPMPSSGIAVAET